MRRRGTCACPLLVYGRRRTGGPQREPHCMWPFRRRPRAPDPAETLARQARMLADVGEPRDGRGGRARPSASMRSGRVRPGSTSGSRGMPRRSTSGATHSRSSAASSASARPGSRSSSVARVSSPDVRPSSPDVRPARRRESELAGRDGELVERERRSSPRSWRCGAAPTSWTRSSGGSAGARTSCTRARPVCWRTS